MQPTELTGTIVPLVTPFEALGESGDPEAMPLLRDLARNGRVEIVRSAAGRAAWKLAHAEEMAERSLEERLDRVERANAELEVEVERLRARAGAESKPAERR